MINKMTVKGAVIKLHHTLFYQHNGNTKHITDQMPAVLDYSYKLTKTCINNTRTIKLAHHKSTSRHYNALDSSKTVHSYNYVSKLTSLTQMKITIF